MLARLAFTKFQGLKIFSDNTYQTVFEKINKLAVIYSTVIHVFTQS